MSLLLSLLVFQTVQMDSKDVLTRLVTGDYGRCVAQNKPDLARRAVMEDWDAEQIRNSAIQDRACVSMGSMTIGPLHLKASLAGALIDLEKIDASAEAVRSAPAFAYRRYGPPAMIDDKGRPLSKRKQDEAKRRYHSHIEWLAIAQFGECVVRKEPTAVPVLAKSRVNQPAEVAAFRPFGPHLGRCLPRGVTMQLDKPTLRAALTLAYYRLAKSAVSHSPAAGGAR